MHKITFRRLRAALSLQGILSSTSYRRDRETKDSTEACHVSLRDRYSNCPLFLTILAFADHVPVERAISTDENSHDKPGQRVVHARPRYVDPWRENKQRDRDNAKRRLANTPDCNWRALLRDTYEAASALVTGSLVSLRRRETPRRKISSITLAERNRRVS